MSCCCVPRNNPALQPKTRALLIKWLQFLVFGFLFVVIIITIGMTFEQAQVRKAPTMSSFYTTSNICAIVLNASNQEISSIQTIANQTSTFLQQGNTTSTSPAQNGTTTTTNNDTSMIVAHCGDCGACSNPHDINIYDKTKNTLYHDSVACAKHGLMGGARAASACLQRRVNLTAGCNKCWVVNIMCDLRKCIFSCFFHAMFKKGVGHGNGTQRETLNRCTKCDEMRCGSAFLKCAGANRRRAGIQSDIDRPGREVCSAVDKEWWKNESLQEAWEDYSGSDRNASTALAPAMSPIHRLRHF
jgi:hypothetical protein